MSHVGVIPPAATAELASHILSRSCPFERLLIPPSATSSEANNAFRQLSLLWHPDKCKHLPQASEVFKALTEAVQAVRRLQQHTDRGAHRQPRQDTECHPWWAAYADPAPATAAAATAARAHGGAAAPTFQAQAAAAAWATRAGGSAWARGSVPAPAAAHSGPSTAGGPRDGTGRAFSSEDAADGGLSGSPEKGHGSGAQEPLQPHRNLYQQQPQPNTASAWWSTRPGGMGPTAGSPIAGEPAANPQKRRTRGSEQLEAPRNGRKGGAKPEDAAAVMAGTSAASVADAATAGAKRSRVTAAAAAQHSGRRRAVTEEPLDRGGTDASERSSLEAGQGDEAGEQAPSSGFEAGASAWGAANGLWLRRPVFVPTVMLAEGGVSLQPRGRKLGCNRRASGSQDDIEDESGDEGRVGGAGRSRGGPASGDGSSGASDSEDASTSEEMEDDDDAFEAPQSSRLRPGQPGLGVAPIRPGSFYGATAAAPAHAGGAPTAAPPSQSGGGSGWAAGCSRSRLQPLADRLGSSTDVGPSNGNTVCGDGKDGGLGRGRRAARKAGQALRSRLQKQARDPGSQGNSTQERLGATQASGLCEPAAVGHCAGELERKKQQQQQGAGSDQPKGCSVWWQHLGPATDAGGDPHRSEPRGALGPGAAGLRSDHAAGCRAESLSHGSQEWAGAEGEGQACGVARARSVPLLHAGEQGRCGQPVDVPQEDRQEEEGCGQDDGVHYGDEYENTPGHGWAGVDEQGEGDVPYDDAGWDAADETAEAQGHDGDVWQEPRSHEAYGSGNILDAFLTQVRQDGELNAQRAGQERIASLRKAAFQNKFRGGGRGRGVRGKVAGKRPAKAARGDGAGAAKQGGGGAGGSGRGRGAAGCTGGSSAVGILRFAKASAVR